MAKPEWGAKRQCKSCGAKFYDLNRVPVMCPKCETELVIEPESPPRPVAKPEPKPKTAKPAVAPVAANDDSDVDEELLTLEDDEASEEDYLEDASELGEDEDDMAEVLESTVSGDDEV